MTTLPRSAKTLRDIPEDIQLKLGASHGLINLELKIFIIFGAKLSSWTAKNNSETQV